MSVVRPIDHDIEQPQNHALNQITSSKMLMRIRCHFPLFTDQILLEYRTHWMKHINPIVYIPTVFVYFLFLISQCGLFGLASSDGDTTTYVVRMIAVLSTIICELFFGLFCTFHFLRITGRDHDAFKVRLKKWFPFGMEDSMTVGGVFAWSLFLIARMLEGQCPPGTNLWQQQTCNPFADRGGIPAGMVSTLYALPWIAQLLMRCISIHALVVCYMLSFAVVAFCVFYTKTNFYASFPDLVVIALFANGTFEITRLQRLSFVDMKKAKEQEQMKMESKRSLVR